MLKPSGRGSRGRGNSRGPSRGGIQKARSSPAPRVDRDGDLDMGSAATAGTRGGRGGRGGRNNTNKSNQPRDRKAARPAKNPFDNIVRVQQAIAKGIESGDAIVHKGKHQAKKTEQINVRGWKSSKAAANEGGCLNLLKDFIERKASKFAGHNIKLTSTRTHGEDYIVNVSPEDAQHILKLNSFSFAGATLEIDQKEKSSSSNHAQTERSDKKPEISEAGKQLKERMKSMLDRRYNPELKLLDLSSLGTDPEFSDSGIFDSQSTQTKFVPALMKVCGEGFPSAAKKRELVVSITLASNGLPDVSAVTSVAQTFPDILNLDLSNNNIKNLSGLRQWSRRFKNLDQLLLLGNPIETEQPDYHKTVTSWFRTLKTLNNVQVRTEEEAAKFRKPQKLSPMIAPARFDDVNNIAENFIKYFFPLFDTDRSNLVNSLYDAESTFSFNINVNGIASDEWKPVGWGDLMKHNRNLIRMTHLATRVKRSSAGPAEIRDVWNSMPPTKHPDVLAEPQRWCIESHPVPHLPDPSGSTSAGLSGLMVIVHGQLAELKTPTGEIHAMRSFDRTFILGAGGGISGLRVVSDMLTLRTFGGTDGYIPTSTPTTTAVSDDASKDNLIRELSKVTNLTLEYARLCLEQVNWDPQAAIPAFEQVRSTLPPEAFISTEL